MAIVSLWMNNYLFVFRWYLSQAFLKGDLPRLRKSS